MSSTEAIRNPGDLEDLLRTLVEETIDGKDGLEARGLMGARVLHPGETIDPSFVIKMPDGRQFLVMVRDQSADAPPL